VDMQVVILAGGLATRLGDLTRNQPKSMVKVREKPFLEHQLELLKGVGVRNVVLCIGHMGEQIESYFGDGIKHGVNIKYSVEEVPLGTAGALKKAENLLNGVFFTMYGDSYLNLDFAKVMRYFTSRHKLALMTVFKNFNRYDSSNTVIERNLVKKYSKKQWTRDMVYIEYGANIFRKEVLNMIPENQPYPLDDLFPRLIEMEELLAYEVMERFYEIGSRRGIADFEAYMRGAP